MDQNELPTGKIQLRKLTLRSVLGFGKHHMLTVLEVINLKQHEYLIWIYYNANTIDFNEETKEYLRITLDREIDKPGKKPDSYPQFRGQMLFEIIERDETYAKDNPEKFFLLNQKKAEKKRVIMANCIRQNKEKSRINNRNRNQKH